MQISRCSLVRFAALVFIVQCSAFAAVAAAWWDDEHRTIAYIAERYLTDHSRQQIDQLIGDGSLVSVCLWADRIKSQQRWAHTRPWHYVNIEQEQSVASFKAKEEGDILWALEYFYGELGNPRLSSKKRRQALLFFVHFVADIHQPLHVGSHTDRGGNRIKVNWYGRGKIYNLHQIWDRLLTRNNLSPADYAQRLLADATQQQVSEWRAASFKDWAQESHHLLVDVYNFDPPNKHSKPLVLGEPYMHFAQPIAERRMLQAGIRLAYYLNLVFEEKALKLSKMRLNVAKITKNSQKLQ